MKNKTEGIIEKRTIKWIRKKKKNEKNERENK